MAKKQNKEGQNKGNKGHGKQNAVNLGSVSKNIESTERGRAGIRNAAKARDNRRETEREQGTFYARVNADRSNDIDAALRGEIGLYAFPGGSEPSVQFNVQKEAAGPVIRLETIQEGHELSGKVFNPNTYLPVSFIMKFGTSFRSRSDNRLAAKTQEIICRYFGELVENEAEESLEQLISRASKDYQSLVAGKDGLYLYEKEGKRALFEIETTKWPAVKALHSEFPELVSSNVFIPVHCLQKPSLEQVVKQDEVYERQFALYLFLRNAMAAALEKPKVGNQPEKKLSKKEEQKLEKKRQEKVADANARAEAQTALHAMKSQAVSVIKAVSSGLGYVDMSDGSGELVVLFGMVGGDRVISVAYIGETHMLRLAKADTSTWVYAGQVRAGMVSRFDSGAMHLSKEEVGAKTALINYLRKKFEEHHIKVPPRTQPKLALAA